MHRVLVGDDSTHRKQSHQSTQEGKFFCPHERVENFIAIGIGYKAHQSVLRRESDDERRARSRRAFTKQVDTYQRQLFMLELRVIQYQGALFFGFRPWKYSAGRYREHS